MNTENTITVRYGNLRDSDAQAEIEGAIDPDPEFERRETLQDSFDRHHSSIE
jgi:hypothetical protein